VSNFQNTPIYIFLLLGLSGILNPTHAQPSFYEEKVITILIGDQRGSDIDVNARMLAKYLGKYVAGRPNFKVKNFSNNNNQVWTIGDKGDDKNGLTVIYSQFKPLSQLLGNKVSQINYLNKPFIGGFLNPSLVYVSTLAAKRPEHLLNVAGARYAGGGSTDPVDILGRFGMDVLGIKYVYATGFRGYDATFQAMLDGNIEIQSVPLNFYRQKAEAILVKTGKVIPLWYNPWPGHQKTAVKLTGYVPSYDDYYKKVKGQTPTGKSYENYKWMSMVLNGLSYSAFMMPQSPKPAVRALRRGFARVAVDTEFLAEQKKKLGVNLPYVNREAGNRIFRLMSKASKERLKMLQDLVNVEIGA